MANCITLNQTSYHGAGAIQSIPDEVKAPVKKGDTIGRICYRISGKEIGSVNLIASTPVEKADFGDYLKKIWKKLL